MTAEPATTSPESEATPAEAVPGAEVAAAPGSAAVEPDRGPGQALPSIIVDPSLSMPDIPAVSATEPSAAVAVPTPAAPDADAAAATAAPSDAAFDEASSAYRPSWEGSVPSAAPIGTQGPTSVHPSLAPVGVTDDDDSITPLHTKEARQRAMLGAGAMVLGFVVLAYLGISSSTKTDMPAPWNTGSEETAKAQPSGAEPGDPPGPQHGTGATEGAQAMPPQPTAAVPATAPAPAPVAAPATRHVRITTVPANAQLVLDGAPVANPLDLQAPTGGAHTLEAHAPGFVSLARALPTEGDVDLVLALTAAAAPAPAPQPTPEAATPVPMPAPKAPVAPVVETAEARAPEQRATAPAAATRPASKRKAASSVSRATSTATARPATKPAAKSKKGAGFVADSPY